MEKQSIIEEAFRINFAEPNFIQVSLQYLCLHLHNSLYCLIKTLKCLKNLVSSGMIFILMHQDHLDCSEMSHISMM